MNLIHFFHSSAYTLVDKGCLLFKERDVIKMSRKIIAGVTVMLYLCTLLSACTQEIRIDRYELSKRLEKTNKEYSLNAGDIIIEDEKQYIFYSLNSESDCLLTLLTGNAGRIESISLTLDSSKWTQSAVTQYFLPLCKAVLASFCYNDDELIEEVISALRLDEADTYFSGKFTCEERGGYSFTLFSNETGVVIECAFTGNQATSEALSE